MLNLITSKWGNFLAPNKERSFVFIHIQKNAGKSIRRALYLQGGADHRLAKVIRSNLRLFVRNPWDRLVSAYFYRVQGGNGSLDDLSRAKHYPDSFDAFCERIEEFKTLPNESMFVSQVDWISDVNAMQIIDFVGRIENIQEDFDIVCEELKRPSIKLPHVNKSQHKSYRDIYTSKTKNLVAIAYKDDIERYKYSF